MHFRNTLAGLAMALAMTAGTAEAQGHVFGVITSETSPMTVGVMEWLGNVDAAMEGGYDHSVVSGGALIGKGTEVSGFTDGIVDGGFVSVLYYPSELPINNMLGNLNLLAKDSRAAGAAVLETVLLHCESCLDELVEVNIMPFGSYATSPYSLFCKEPVASLADLKGRAVRAVGTLGRLADALGAVPVNLGIGEIYEGLQRGQLACTFFTPGTALNYSLNDVAPNLILVSAGPVIGPTGMALRYDLWEELDEKTRRSFIDAAPSAVATSIYGYFADDAKVVGSGSEHGLNVTQPSDDLKAAVDGFADKSVEEAIAAAKERGVGNAAEIVEVFKTTLAKWDGIVAEIGGDDSAGFAAALEREIYNNFPIDR